MAIISSASAPAIDLEPITPDDDNPLGPARGLRCRGDGTAGTVRMVTAKGITRNTYISPGEMIPVEFTAVHATGTTATGLEALI